MLKAQVAGSINAIEHEIEKVKKIAAEAGDRVRIKIVSSAIGTITENDVKLSSGRNPGIIIGLDVGIDGSAKDLAERAGVTIKTFDIIYKISEWLEEEVINKTPKMMVEEITAEGKVLKMFSSMKDKHIIGVRVEKGTIFTGDEAKIMRKGVEDGLGVVRELQKDKNKVGEVREGMEFGCQFFKIIEK